MEQFTPQQNDTVERTRQWMNHTLLEGAKAMIFGKTLQLVRISNKKLVGMSAESDHPRLIIDAPARPVDYFH